MRPVSSGVSWARLSKRVVEVLPRALRNPLVRRRTHFDPGLLQGVEVALARTEEEYLAAFRVVHDAYVGRGWIQPEPSGLWVTPHHVLPESTILVLRRHGETLGSVALIEDSSVGLPIDHTFGDETRALRAPDRHLVEFGSLAVSPHLRGVGLALTMVISAWRYARHRLSATDMVIAVSASMGPYYDALFEFRPYAPVKNYLGFGETQRALDSDPVLALHHRVEATTRFVEDAWPSPPPGRLNIATLGLSPFPAEFERFPPRELGRNALVRYKLPREVFQRLFLQQTDLVARLDPQTRKHLLTWRTEATVEGHDGPFKVRFTPPSR